MAAPTAKSYSAASGLSIKGGRGTPAGSVPAWVSNMPLMALREITSNTIMDLRPANDPAINPNYGTGTRAPWEVQATLNDIFNEWNGGALDLDRSRFWTGGGGHSGYQGIEMYAVDLNVASPAYARYSTPSGSIPFPCDLTAAGADSAVDAIGRPRQVHNYNLLSVDPATGDLLMAPGGFNIFGGGAARGFRLRRDTGEWDTSNPIQKHASFDVAGGAAFDTVTGLLWTVCNGGLFSVDLTTGVMTRRAVLGTFNDGQYQKLVADPTNGVMYIFQHKPLTGAMAGKPAAGFTPTPTGTVTVYGLDMPMTADGAGSHGVDWDADGNRLLIYRGGSDLRSYKAPASPLSGTWTEESVSLNTSAVTPPVSNTAAGSSFYGRFRVSKKLGIAVVQSTAASKLQAFRLR